MTQPTNALPSHARRLALNRLCRLRHATGRPDAAPESEGAPRAARRDEAQANRLVRGVLCHLALLDELIDRMKLFDRLRTPESVVWILRLASYERIFQRSAPDYAIGEQAVELARHVADESSAKFVNAILRKLLPALPETPEALAAIAEECPPEIRWSVPRRLLAALRSGYGPSANAVIERLAGGEPPLWLRVNTLKANPAEMLRTLKERGIEVEAPSPLPEALLWKGGETLPWQLPEWERGELTVQDLGAMLTVELLDLHPAMRVLDYCAAPGGKTGHIWQRMKGIGRLVAWEMDAARRPLLRQAMERLYGSPKGIEIPNREEEFKSSTGGVFSAVIVDAPCLALGLIGRHPELRWEDRLAARARVVTTQRRILDSAARHLANRGRLLWVTCSPTRDENEGIVLPWLEQCPYFRLVDPWEMLKPSWRGLVEEREGFIRTRPDRLASDGFAMALIERVGRRWAS